MYPFTSKEFRKKVKEMSFLSNELHMENEDCEYIMNNASQDELEELFSDSKSYQDKRSVLRIKKKYMELRRVEQLSTKT